MFRHLVVCLAIGLGHGWWKPEGSKDEDPWRVWAIEKVPKAVEYYDYLHESTASTRQTVGSWGEAISERGLWVVFDGIAGLFGWALFGSAWSDVKSGIRKLIQLVIVVVLCVIVHYVWAICWPVISLVGAVVMTVVWIVRKGLRVAGSLMYHLQRLCGGTPEAVDAEFFGPGMGQTPETSDLRRLKYAASAEKWIVVKREGRVAVFKLSSENCSIRSSGLFAGIEPDTLRGSPGLLKDLKGYDKVHLCRANTCAEDGQHFQIYGLAKKFDPVRFQMILSSQGAKEAGETLWSWATKGSRVLAEKVGDFGSESETEDVQCQGHRIRWSTDDGDEFLCAGACKDPAKEQVGLLQEDQFESSVEASLCPTHAAKYLLKRFQYKCSYQGCNRLGKVTAGGVSLCWNHESEAQRRRSRSRSRERREPEEKDIAANYFEAMLDSGGFPMAESSGCSGRYPKQWDLQCWRRILARPDVDFVEFRMCSFGLGPPDEPGSFYQHLTRVVFPRNDAVRAALSRRCPGVSSAHRHIPLKGARPGISVTRCTEAGVYCPEFVQTICNVVRESLFVGGVCPSLKIKDKLSNKAGGGHREQAEEAGDERDEAAENAGEATEDAGEATKDEATEDAGAEDAGEATEDAGEDTENAGEDTKEEAAEIAGVATAESNAEDAGEFFGATEAAEEKASMNASEDAVKKATEEVDEAVEETEKGAVMRETGEDTKDTVNDEGAEGTGEEYYTPENDEGVDVVMENSQENGANEGGEEEVETRASGSGVPRWVSDGVGLPGTWEDGRENPLDVWIQRLRDGEAELSPNHREMNPRGVWAEEPLPESQQGPGQLDHGDTPEDYMQTYSGGYVVVHHCRPRQELFFPGGVGFPIDPARLRNERMSACKWSTGLFARTDTMMTIEDNWREAGPHKQIAGGGWWTGFTVLVLQGKALPWDTPPQREGHHEEGGDEETMDDDPEVSDGPSSTSCRTTAATKGSNSRSRSRSSRRMRLVVPWSSWRRTT